MTDNIEDLWPKWAIGKAVSAMQMGAQLCTRDGRTVGNAVTIGVQTYNGDPFAIVLTDAGTTLHYNQQELDSLFHAPVWLMDPKTHPAAVRVANVEQQSNPGGIPAFAKLFQSERYGQVLAMLDQNEDGLPALIWYAQPPELGVCRFDLSFPDTDHGNALAEKAFTAADAAMAERAGKMMFEMSGERAR